MGSDLELRIRYLWMQLDHLTVFQDGGVVYRSHVEELLVLLSNVVPTPPALRSTPVIEDRTDSPFDEWLCVQGIVFPETPVLRPWQMY